MWLWRMCQPNNDRQDEFSDFTDSQKEYINKVLEEKLKHQREKLMNYFSVNNTYN